MYKYLSMMVMSFMLFHLSIFPQTTDSQRGNCHKEKIVLLKVKHFQNPVLIFVDSCYVNQIIGYNDYLLHPLGLIVDVPENHSDSIQVAIDSCINDYYYFHRFFFPTFIRNIVLPNIDTTSYFQLLDNTFPTYAANPFYRLTQNLKWQQGGGYEYAKINHSDFLVILISYELLLEYRKSLSIDPDTFQVKDCPNQITYYKLAIPISIE